MRPERNIFALLFILRPKKAPVGTANPPFGGFSGRSLRGTRREHSRTIAGLRGARLRPAQSCGLHFRFWCLLFADGGRTHTSLGELQSAAVGRRQTARLAESQKVFVIPHFSFFRKRKMNGISTENTPFAMPILTSFGGMTYFSYVTFCADKR